MDRFCYRFRQYRRRSCQRGRDMGADCRRRWLHSRRCVAATDRAGSIRSNVLSPSPTETPLVDHQPPETIARMVSTVPMERMGSIMSGEVKIARQLIAEKATLSTAELAAAESHRARLRAGRSESIESSSPHLDV